MFQSISERQLTEYTNGHQTLPKYLYNLKDKEIEQMEKLISKIYVQMNYFNINISCNIKKKCSRKTEDFNLYKHLLRANMACTL